MSSYPCGSAAAFVISTIVALCWHVILSRSLFLTLAQRRGRMSQWKTLWPLSLNHSLSFFFFQSFFSLLTPLISLRILNTNWYYRILEQKIHTYCIVHIYLFSFNLLYFSVYMSPSIFNLHFFFLEHPLASLSRSFPLTHITHVVWVISLSQGTRHFHSHTYTHTRSHSLQSSSWSLRQY